MNKQITFHDIMSRYTRFLNKPASQKLRQTTPRQWPLLLAALPILD